MTPASHSLWIYTHPLRRATLQIFCIQDRETNRRKVNVTTCKASSNLGSELCIELIWSHLDCSLTIRVSNRV
ncbi:Uncharacterized protein HZ326_11487 [Fusarium oxysporum f. sp. albedinis]|nr:Uncharacterized protein HZ326_11487 [Fusarium oxysporum f. sp. albedinis]